MQKDDRAVVKKKFGHGYRVLKVRQTGVAQWGPCPPLFNTLKSMPLTLGSPQFIFPRHTNFLLQIRLFYIDPGIHNHNQDQ